MNDPNEPPDTTGILSNVDETVRLLNALTPHQVGHLQDITEALLKCFIDDKVHGLVLIGNASDRISMYAVNASEMDCAALLTAADEHIHYRALDGAPPKEAFN